MSLFKLEKGLKIYYATFKLKYDNTFTTILEESGMDDEDLNAEMTSDATDFTLSDFDENFPLYPEIQNEEERSLEMFRICNNCYKYGEPPQIQCPPRNPKEKIPYFYWYQDMNYIRICMKFLSDNVLNSPAVEFENPEIFKMRITSDTFHVSVYNEYELQFNFRHRINPNRVQYKRLILGKMIDFIFEKHTKNKYWDHLLIEYHHKQYKQYCKIDWDNFLDKDEAIKKEKGIDDEDDAFEQYRAPQPTDDEKSDSEQDDEKLDESKAIELPETNIKNENEKKMELMKKEYVFKNINYCNNNIVCLDEEFNDVIFDLPDGNKELMDKIKN
eukprot:222050_1